MEATPGCALVAVIAPHVVPDNRAGLRALAITDARPTTDGTSMSRTYKVVDVFTSRPLLGNPVAVVLEAEGLDTTDMQRIARWTNLSETTFLLPPTVPGADYRLRIFTPRSELPFAGHPTLGSAHAALEAGRVQARDGRLVHECGVGLIALAVRGDGADRRLTFDLPPARLTPLQPGDIDELEAVLGHPVVRGIAPAVVNVGPQWVVAQLPSAADLLALRPDFARSAAFERRLGVTGLSVFALHDGGSEEIEVRSFAPSCGVDEDPVCGSGNGSVAVFLRERHLIAAQGTRYTAAQGQCVGREGRVAVTVRPDGAVSVGGSCVTCVDGRLTC
ncbi:MAG TPA: PhzF family phenazine biosynthesis protein [Methylibium sp.]|nr:PhzF family phenazine biosynthesis protein [Methylibium sp.]